MRCSLISKLTSNDSRSISELRKDGILNVYGKRIEILQPKMLMKLRDLS
jgi:hypothetical protein